ncbi:MAG: ABC transporter ATP-binding protein, partial [Propionibacteriaceae bacterium]|nr:ABC transporter ATP-binding protein [Propionibacteriaceae bacterium]
MLKLLDVRKTYHAGGFTQHALDGINVTFRDSEFVAVLGPSGSGKTTLLNIVGGLDHYDSGDLVIDGTSTKEYNDRDWDTYRNNRVGFVFQSYNLIPHQTVLANVELALTLSGVGRSERSERATSALEQVGLSEHIHKLPNQLSGGQMQRVAIARAIVNDPEILLADEPTGALDSKTSVDVMGLLQTIAKDRLVVMVTHNPELANQYATRIVSLRDGNIVADTSPFDGQTHRRRVAPARRSSMSFLTAISLSFNNLLTKKGRTLMTSFAGSIGIIGIAAILAIANGVNAYIKSVEEDTLSLYPLTIQSQGIDLTSLLTADRSDGAGNLTSSNSGDVGEAAMINRMFAQVGTNDLTALKAFLDSPESGIDPWVNAIEYHYDLTPQIFSAAPDQLRQVNPNTVFASLGFGSETSSSLVSSLGMSADVFDELPADSSLASDQYDTVAGRWPSAADECLVVLTAQGRIFDLMAYAMGLRDPSELDEMVAQLASNQVIQSDSDSRSYSYQQVLDTQFKVVDPSAYYQYDQNYNVWSDRRNDASWMRTVVDEGMPLKVVGIVAPTDGATSTMLSAGIYYSPALIDTLMTKAQASPIVQQQLANPTIDVFSGQSFDSLSQQNSLTDFDFSSFISIDQAALSQM